jgi:hypothetical protein
MADFEPILVKNFDASKVNYTSSKVMAGTGAKLFFLDYDGGPLVIQSPEMPLTFDPRMYPEDTGDNWDKCDVKSSLNLSNESCKVFYEKMNDFDNRIKELAKENSVEWFKKKNMSDEVIDSMFYPTAKDHIDQETGELSGRFPPMFGFKVKKKDGNIMCRCFDENKVEINLNNPEGDNHMKVDNILKKNTSVKGLLKCDFIWGPPSKLGVTWSAQQLKVKVPKGFDEFAFIEDEDDKEAERLSNIKFVESESEDEASVEEA